MTMLEQNNPDVMRQMIDDHQSHLLAGTQRQVWRMTPQAPGRIRVTCGQVLIQIGERLRGAQAATAESRPVHLALAD